MKIAYYLPSLYAPGGLERIVTFKANYLAEHCEGYEVYIITSEQRDRQIHFSQHAGFLLECAGRQEWQQRLSEYLQVLLVRNCIMQKYI